MTLFGLDIKIETIIAPPISGLPAIVCHHSLQAALVTASDYPSPSVIENLKENVERFRDSSNEREINVVPYNWSEPVTELLSLNHGRKYDIVMCAECLWHHDSHNILAQSIMDVLRVGGHLLMSFSHHIPGLESNDLAFFAILERNNFSIVGKHTYDSVHMWSDRAVEIYVYELERKE